MNRVWRLHGTGITALRSENGPIPVPRAGEVLVRVVAGAINHRDLGILGGHYPNPLGIIPFSDASGVIEAVGDGVGDFAVGDAVISSFYPLWESGPPNAANHRVSLGCEVSGILGERVILPASALVPKPVSLSHAEASTLPCAGLTAWTALFTEGQLKAAQTVLIQGTGGVAVFALQLARMAGARTIVLTSHPEKAERAKAMGADVTIDYRAHPDWADQVMAATGGEGADLIVELGGQDTLTQSLNCVKTGGRISVIGVLSGLTATIPVPAILFRHIYLTGITVGHRSDLAALCRALDYTGIRPVIDRSFGFDEVPAIYEALPKGAHFGKLVVELEG